jgi:hypothetical protein
MDKSDLLELKNTLTVYEAAQLLTRNKVAGQVAVTAIVDAINLNELAATVKRWPKYDADAAANSSEGEINQMETTVLRGDLDAWLKTRRWAVAVQVIANLQNAQIRHGVKQRTATAQDMPQVNDPLTGVASARMQNVWSTALGQVKSARINARAEIGVITTHRLTETNPHELAEVISKATKSAVDGKDYKSVWTALEKLAASGCPPRPLLGQVERESIKYEAGNRVKLFTKSALRRMMIRAAAKCAK